MNGLRLEAAIEVASLLVRVGNASCWGLVGLVWVAGAIYNDAHAPRVRLRGRRESSALFVAIAVCVMFVLLSRRYGQELALDSFWVRVVGVAVLVASTAFTLWARFSLGTMWTLESAVKDGHQLRTHGAYAVTRHPIYTGLLGMLLGSAMLSGLGQWIVLVPVGLIAFGLKIHAEERLLVRAFPVDYPRYRQQVPQLVPGLTVLRRRRSGGSHADVVP